jgi:hypothetical protein
MAAPSACGIKSIEPARVPVSKIKIAKTVGSIDLIINDLNLYAIKKLLDFFRS